MTRKEVRDALHKLNVTNRFKLRTVNFSDLARGEAQFVTILDWKHDPVKANEIKVAFRDTGVIPEFDY